MHIRLSPQLLQKFPGISTIVLVQKNIKNQRKSSIVEQLLRGACAEKKREIAQDSKKNSLKELLASTLQEDTTLPETEFFESLLKKIHKGAEIKNNNNALDLLYYFGIKYLIPFFGHDLDQIETLIDIHFKKSSKTKKDFNFGIAKETQHVVMWFLNLGNYAKEDFQHLPQEFAKVLQKYCGGQSEIYFLDQEHPEVDLNYVSLKEAMQRERMSQEPLEQKEAALLPPPQPLLKDLLATELQKVLGNLGQKLDIISPLFAETAQLETPREKNHGDYATSIALKLAKALVKTPQEIAEAIIQEFPPLPFLEKIEIAGPGFINFYISQEYLRNELDKILEHKDYYGRLSVGQNKKVLVEFSSPNIAKPMGAHHLPSTLIGQALSNIFRFGGYNVVNLNWLGDWGTQFGKLLYAYKNWGNEEIVKQHPLNELLKLYVKFHDEAEKDASLDDKGREEFKKLEEGNEENRKLWQWFREISLEELKKLYSRLDITFDEYLGEEMYLESSKKIIEIGLQKGIIIKGEKGALIVQFEHDKYSPYILQKADGTTLYATRDLATIQDRLERYKPEKIIYVVDVAQKLHFEQLFETAKMYGFTQSELIHVMFGRVQFKDKKMSTRKGTMILLDDLLKEALARTEVIVNQKSPNVSPEEKKEIIEGVALGGLKYHILSQNRETNLIFDWDRMLSLEGNSAPYLQYTYARAHSILRKANEIPDEKNDAQLDIFSMDEEKRIAQDQDKKPFDHPKEQELLHLFIKFPEVIEQTLLTLRPHLVSNYLFELAQAFNSFYQDVPVLSAGKPDLLQSRLKMVEACSQIIKNGLALLGIKVFEKM